MGSTGWCPRDSLLVTGSFAGTPAGRPSGFGNFMRFFGATLLLPNVLIASTSAGVAKSTRLPSSQHNLVGRADENGTDNGGYVRLAWRNYKHKT